MNAFLYVLGIGVGFGYRSLRALRIDRPRAYYAGVRQGRMNHAGTALENHPDEYANGIPDASEERPK